MPRNERKPLTPGEVVQLAKLVEGLGMKTTAGLFGLSQDAIRNAMNGGLLNQPTRISLLRSKDGWIRPCPVRNAS